MQKMLTCLARQGIGSMAGIRQDYGLPTWPRPGWHAQLSTVKTCPVLGLAHADCGENADLLGAAGDGQRGRDQAELAVSHHSHAQAGALSRQLPALEHLPAGGGACAQIQLLSACWALRVMMAANVDRMAASTGHALAGSCQPLKPSLLMVVPALAHSCCQVSFIEMSDD